MTPPLQIIITGASGFIGAHLVSGAGKLGLTILTLSRRGATLAGGARAAAWSLGEPLPSDALQPADWVIHLAHDFGGEESASKTIEGTMDAMAAFRAAGVRRQMFFSSLSAHPNATSLYGRTKFAIEKRIESSPDVVIVRPGLVLGEGGIYGRIRQWVRRWPFAPLPDGGRGAVHAIEIEKLCRQVLFILTQKSECREFNLFDARARRLRDLVQEEAAKNGRRVVIIPIPSRLLLFALALGEGLKLPLPVNADNLSGFLANQSNVHRPTTLDLT